jgi:hypothetical protein
VRVVKWASGDNPVSLMFRNPWQACQVFPRGLIDVDGLISAHALLYALSYGLGISPHGFGRIGGALPDLIGAVFVVSTRSQQGNKQGKRGELERTKIYTRHPFLMP